jgi:tight adherence protein C
MAGEKFPFDIPFGLTPADAATLLAAVATVAAMLAVWAATTVRDPMRGRIKALQAQREVLKSGLITARRRQTAKPSAAATDAMRQMLSRLKVLQSEQVRGIQDKLAQAGWRSKDAIVKYQFARLIAPFVFGILAVILIYGDFILVGKSPGVKGLVAMGIVGFSYMLPDIWVKNAITKRVDAIRKSLPDALDLLVICAEAGLTVEAGFNRVAKELGRAFPEMADEMALTAIELGFLQDRRAAFDNLSKRVELQAVRAVVTTLVQTEKYGTPLASSLRVLSAEFRNERMMKAEEKAARLPAIMTVPLIVFIMPFLFVVLMGPAACQISDNFVNMKQ